MNTAREIYIKKLRGIHGHLFTKKLNPDSHEKWKWTQVFRGKACGIFVIDLIEKNLDDGNSVKCGYTCTQIRGHHDRWILVKAPKSKQPFWEDLADQSKDGFLRNIP